VVRRTTVNAPRKGGNHTYPIWRPKMLHHYNIVYRPYDAKPEVNSYSVVEWDKPRDLSAALVLAAKKAAEVPNSGWVTVEAVHVNGGVDGPTMHHTEAVALVRGLKYGEQS
jgi:hypothetical protein